MTADLHDLNARRDAMRSLEDAHIVRGPSGPYPPDMEPRVAALEAGMLEMKDTLRRLEPMIIRLDERTVTMATKEDVANVRTDLATKATRGTVWGMGFTVAGLFVAALALGAAYVPFIEPLFKHAP